MWTAGWTLPGECYPLPPPPLCHQGTTDTAILPCPSGPGRLRRSVTGPLLQRRQSGRGRPCRFEATLSDSKPSVLYRDARPHADGSRIGSQGHRGTWAQGHRGGQMRRGPTLGDPRGVGTGSVLRRRRRETPPRPPLHPQVLFPLIGSDTNEEPRAGPLPSTAVGQVMGGENGL